MVSHNPPPPPPSHATYPLPTLAPTHPLNTSSQPIRSAVPVSSSGKSYGESGKNDTMNVSGRSDKSKMSQKSTFSGGVGSQKSTMSGAGSDFDERGSRTESPKVEVEQMYLLSEKEFGSVRDLAAIATDAQRKQWKKKNKKPKRPTYDSDMVIASSTATTKGALSVSAKADAGGGSRPSSSSSERRGRSLTPTKGGTANAGGASSRRSKSPVMVTDEKKDDIIVDGKKQKNRRTTF